MAHNRRRLEELAASVGVFMNDTPPIPEPNLVSLVSENDIKAAEALLKQKRHEEFTSKSHLFRRTPSQRAFKKSEIYAAIESVIRDGGSSGVLECLLTHFKELTAKRKLFKPQTDAKNVKMGALLGLAAERKNSTMVSFLAPYSDDASLNICLRYSVTAVDLECTKALIRAGADPNACCAEFLQNVKSGDIRLAGLLLTSEKRIASPYLDEALLAAVSQGCLEIMVPLLQQGANADSLGLLEVVVKAKNINSVAAMVLAKRPPGQRSISHALGMILCESKLLTEEDRMIIHMLLCAGASGDNVTNALVRAVATNDTELALKIVTHCEPISYDRSSAILEAIKGDSFQLLNILFGRELPAVCASAVLERFSTVSEILPSSRKLWILSMLVRSGASITGTNEYLIESVRQKDELLVKFLVDHGASVDHQNAKALSLALLSNEFSIFKKLLDGQPSQETLSLCFRSLPSLHAPLQLKFASALLVAGARGGDVDNALIRVFSEQSMEDRNEFIDLLVRHGADVNTKSGYCLRTAAEAGDIVSLSILLKGKPSVLSLSSAVKTAGNLCDRDLRFTIIDLLLSAGARGPLINSQFVELSRETPTDIVLISLFLEKGEADVNAHEGSVMQHASRKADLELLKILKQYQPSASTLSGAFDTALSLEDPQIRQKICHMLLEAGVRGESLNLALIAEQRSFSPNSKLMELLLVYGADVDFRNGAVIQWAIQHSDEQQLRLLASRILLRQTIISGLRLLLQKDTRKRCEMAKILLKSTNLCLVESLTSILPEAIGLGTQDIDLLKLLLLHGASVDYQQGLAIRKAIEMNYSEVFELLLKQFPAPDTLEFILGFCFAADTSRNLQYIGPVLEAGCQGKSVDEALLKAVQDEHCKHDIVTLLLKHGASPLTAQSQPLVHAAKVFDTPTLKLLLDSVSDEGAITYVLGEIISTSMQWLSADGLPTVELLLKHGACGEVVDLALITTIENAAASSKAAQFLDLFLHFGASPDYNDGTALRRAISSGQVSCVKRLMLASPSRGTLRTALLCLIEFDFPESMGVDLLEALSQNWINIQILESELFGEEQRAKGLITCCLEKWPQGTRVLEKLLQNGLNANRCVSYTVKNEYGAEPVSPLLWALLQAQLDIGSHVIECLLNHGADPNFQTPASSISPVLVAAKEKSPDVLQQLIQHGADVEITDKSGKTPLFYASQRNQIESMSYILDRGSGIDDGSLHEAATAINVEAVQLLLSHGHDPNFPSVLHEGRSVLANLCVHASAVGAPLSRIRKTIEALITGKANLRIQSQGKPLLFHALDNRTSCVQITTALLASGGWKFINDECNLLTVNECVYSPTMYVIKSLQKSPKQFALQLHQALKAYDCKDVFYKLSGVQPSDMVNAPQGIMAEQRRWQTRARRLQEQEEDHQLKIKYTDDLAKQQQMLMAQTHNLRIQHGREMADEQEIRVERAAGQQLRLEAELSGQKSRFAQQNRTLEVEHAQTLDRLRLQTLEGHGRLQLGHSEAVAQMERDLADRKLTMEMQRIKELEAAHVRQYQRDNDILARQERVWNQRKEVMDESHGLTAGSSSVSPKLKQITYECSEVD